MIWYAIQPNKQNKQLHMYDLLMNIVIMFKLQAKVNMILESHVKPISFLLII